MKKNLLRLLITVLLLIIFFSGCFEKSSSEVLIIQQASHFALTLDDLPREYIKWSETNNSAEGMITNITPNDSYSATFTYENPDNNTGYPAIALAIMKFNSSEDATIVLRNFSEKTTTTYDFLNRITPQNVEQIGDESFYELYQGSMGEYYGYQNTTVSFVYFKVKNVVVFLLLQGTPDWDINFTDLTINYAKIVNDKILSSLETI